VPLHSIGPTTDQLRDASALISGHFATDIRVIDILRGAGGANDATHVVATDRSGQSWGIKMVTRAVPGGSGTLKEVVVSRLALLLGLTPPPGTLLCPVGFPSCSLNDPVALVPWVPLAKDLDHLDPEEVARIHAGPYRFARQFGEWLAFGLLFSVRDRGNYGNWVWASATQTLAMIDTEEALGNDASYPNDYQNLVNRFLTPAPSHAGITAAVADGMRSVFVRYRECEAAVQHILGHNPMCSGFSSPHSARDPEQVMQEWVSGSGL
jgi:hypothetical protein